MLLNVPSVVCCTEIAGRRIAVAHHAIDKCLGVRGMIAVNYGVCVGGDVIVQKITVQLFAIAGDNVNTGIILLAHVFCRNVSDGARVRAAAACQCAGGGCGALVISSARCVVGEDEQFSLCGGVHCEICIDIDLSMLMYGRKLGKGGRTQRYAQENRNIERMLQRTQALLQQVWCLVWY